MASVRLTIPGFSFRPLVAGRLVGAGLLVAAGAIHLDLYLTGYRAIPTIGPLFLLQVIAAFLLAAVIAATSGWVATASGAGFAIATLGGYLLSIWVGLFGFKEARTTAGIAAAIVELAAFGVLAAVALRATPALRPRGDATKAPALLAMAARVTAAAVFLVAAGLAAGALVTTSGTATTLNPKGQVQLRTARVDGALVLTNPRGLTLYWFAIDSSVQSRCYGTCAAVWPPVLGRPIEGNGVVGRLGTITRTNGALQATYDGHPLYTFAGDSPGTARGNNLNLNGGLWHEVIVAA